MANAWRLPRLAVLTFVVDLVGNPDIETAWVDEALHREAMDLLLARQDKTYSLCDAVSFVLMRQRHLLQCHFGLDTFAWARQGATVTGADFSAEAIKAARALATELHLPATFVHSNLYELPQHLTGQFDVVFTSHGVLGWLPDLEGWAQVIAHFLKPGGIFYMVEVHPFALLFDERRNDAELRLREPYFRGPEPLREEEQGSYAAPDAPIQSVSYAWLHSLADIMGSLLRAGLRLTSFEEYPFMAWAFFPWMERRADGMWQLPSGKGDIPLMFSLRTTKPEGEAGHHGASHA